MSFEFILRNTKVYCLSLLFRDNELMQVYEIIVKNMAEFTL